MLAVTAVTLSTEHPVTPVLDSEKAAVETPVTGALNVTLNSAWSWFVGFAVPASSTIPSTNGNNRKFRISPLSACESDSSAFP